ncbi:MAG: cupin domain-containing protein, partial [Rhodospirillaceae bacterium]
LDRVRKHIKRGATLILNDDATLSSGISNLTNALSQTPGGKVSCNIYCSWQAHQGLDIHFDCHDVFAIQIAGRKRWNVFQRYFQDPINHPAFRQLGQDFHNRNCGPVSLDVTMTPGDLIYIPSGYYHAAMAESEASLHLTFSVVHPIGLDLITAVYERAIYDDLFRRAIPHPSVDNGKKTEQHLVQLAGRFRELVRDEEFQEAFINKLRDFKYETHPLTLPQDAYEDE